MSILGFCNFSNRRNMLILQYSTLIFRIVKYSLSSADVYRYD